MVSGIEQERITDCSRGVAYWRRCCLSTAGDPFAIRTTMKLFDVEAVADSTEPLALKGSLRYRTFHWNNDSASPTSTTAHSTIQRKATN